MEDKGCVIYGVAISFLSLSYIVVALRCYVRLKLTRWGVDDIFAIIALCVFTAITSFLMRSASFGLGKRTKAVASLDAFTEAVKFFFLADMCYIITSGLVKISFCLSLLRVVVVGRIYVWTIYAVGAITVIFTTFYFFFALFSCSPVSYAWERVRQHNQGGTCRQYFKVVSGSYAHGAVVCAGDITLAIVPALMIWKLQLNSRTKLSAGILLGFGSVASVATIARLTYIHHGYDQVDFLYGNADIMVWSMIEIGVSIIAISAVTLKPLLMKYRIFFHSQDTSGRTPHDRGRIYGTDAGDFTCTIGSAPSRKNHYSRQHRSSTHGRMRTDTSIVNGRSSSEENIWISKGDGHTVPSREGVDDDLELIPRGQIQKVVEFSATMVAKEPDHDSKPVSDPRYSEQA
ncbi:integral membrane protein [Histoplasma capsulatum]|uniref:Integral membrane protein n=1 Tax=Ajellomyces capsulatus TaxID=5037 RepID=A0A8A1MCA9_AJECA|nr:integral membrane protein [Histoplasma capsulatum]